ncbi:MAG: helix-turn-helix domain-containing protein [Anaerovoracaceae bacterium]
MRSERNITEISRSMTTGQRLRYLRKIKGFTQIKVQMLTGIDQSDYSRLETDSRYPTVGQAISLAFIFDTSLDYIYGLTDDPAPYPRP